MPKRLFQFALLAFMTFSLIGAASPSPASRFNALGHKLMCTCGCSEILLECNHVGCPNSTGMIADLRSQFNAGASDKAIFQAFAATYGPIVLAAPMRGGFDNVAWIVPFAVLILGIAGIVLLLRLWKRRHAAAGPALPELPASEAASALRVRIREETNYE